MRILVTGAAGFIGSNFVRYWLERHPDDHVVASTCSPTRATARTLPDERARSSRATSATRARRADAARRGDRRRRQLRRRVAQLLAVLDPGRFFRTNVLGTQTLLEAARRAGVQRFHHVSTCEVYGDLPLDSDESFTEESPYRPRTPYNASKAGGRPRRARVLRDVRAAGHDHELLEQLRAVPVPGEGDPALRHERARRQAAAAVRVDAEQARVAARARPLPRDRARARARASRARRTTSARASRSRSRRSPTRVLEHTGKPESLKTIVPDRPGHDRRYLLDSSKLRDELGWEPRSPSRTACARRSPGTRTNRDWWEPLRERRPGRRNRLALKPCPGTPMAAAQDRACARRAGPRPGTAAPGYATAPGLRLDQLSRR